MEGILESSTYRTLHAHNFSRSSSQASLVLTDLLSRYLSLLTSSCAKYAQHAGRLNLTMKDTLSALEEMGVNLDELSEYCKSEGKELGRYAIQTTRRLEDLREIKASLADGLEHGRDGVIHLNYGPIPESFTLEDEEDSEEEEVEAENKDHDEAMVFEPPPPETELINPNVPIPSMLPPPLPLSPVSNPSSPARKRTRSSVWEPPSHVPAFLPPFPVPRDNSAPNSPDQPPPIELPPQRHPLGGKPLSPLPQVSTSTSSSDYLTPVPYSQSSLSTISAWHLPAAPPETSPQFQSTLPRLPTPQTQPALLGAYHHILTHPPSRNANSTNPSRHRVALSLLYQTETNPRWEPADTLFSISAPNAPRVSAMPFSHPVPKKGSEAVVDPKGDKPEQEITRPVLQQMSPHPVTTAERITPLMSQQGSRIPDATRSVLPVSQLFRIGFSLSNGL